MTFSRGTSLVNTFALVARAPSAPNISLPIADHNAPLVGDELFGLQLNYQWRRVLVHLAENMLDRRIYDGTEIEIDTAVQQVQALISDMYTPETIGMDYLGAHVGRSTNLGFSTSPVVIPFENEDTGLLHDVGGFWDGANPFWLEVPTGGAGYYFCHGHVRVGGATEGVVLRLTNGLTFPYARAEHRITNPQTLHVNTTLGFGDGARLALEIRMLSGSRTIIAGSHFTWGATLGMFKVGDAP